MAHDWVVNYIFKSTIHNVANDFNVMKWVLFFIYLFLTRLFFQIISSHILSPLYLPNLENMNRSPTINRAVDEFSRNSISITISYETLERLLICHECGFP